MKASSASGLCASRIVRIELAALPGGATRLPAGNFGRLLVKRVEVLAVLGVLGALLGAFALLVAQEVAIGARSEEHTSELQSRLHLVCRLLLEKKNKYNRIVLTVV